MGLVTPSDRILNRELLIAVQGKLKGKSGLPQKSSVSSNRLLLYDN